MNLYNLRLLIRNQFQSNRFHPHPDVKLDEYVYYGKKMEQVDNPLCQIIDSLIGFLQTGEYKDTTGVAFLNQSPQVDGITQHNNKENINCNRNMNKNKIRLTESQLHRVIKESVKKILREGNDRAAFENACNYLYYGYGFDAWRDAHDYLDPIEADKIWHAAYKKMSMDNDAPFTPHSIESYDDMMRQNDERLNVQPDENGRYPDENLNVLPSDGSDSLYAQGGGPGGVPHKLKGMKAIKQGGMGLAQARDEYEKNFDSINNTPSAKQAFKMGRLGNTRPLYRKGALQDV